MAQISKAVVDSAIRENVFGMLDLSAFKKINDRQYGILVTDMNGETRYVRLGAIVAEQREDITAEELMESEMEAFNQKQADKAEKAKKKEAKIARDKARREAEAKAKEEQANA
jgi:hypothetical protein